MPAFTAPTQRELPPLRPIAAAALLALGCASAQAQTAAAATAPAADATAERVEVVGGRYRRTDTTETAVKMPVPVKELPMNVNVLTASFLDDIGAKSLDDAVQFVSSVSKSRNFSGIYDQFNIRGQFVDQVNGYRLDGGSYVNFFSPDFSFIESIEVLKGPVSTLYGRGLGGGVVNFISKKPTSTPQASAGLSVGSNSFRRAEFDVSRPLSDSVRVRISGANEDGDSFVRNVSNRRSAFYGAVEVAPDAATTVLLQATEQRGRGTHWRGIPLFRDAGGKISLPEQLPRETFVGADFNRYDLSYSTQKLSFSRDLGGGYSLNGIVGSSKLKRAIVTSIADSTINPATGNYELIAYNDATLFEGRQAELNFVAPLKPLGLRGTLLIGADYQRTVGRFGEGEGQTLGTQNIYKPNYRFAVPAMAVSDYDNPTTATGLYAQANVELGAQWRLLAGARHDRYKSNFRDDPETFRETYDDSASTWRLGLTYLVTRDVSVYGGVSTGFSPSETINGNSGKVLPSEKAANQELGIKGDFLDRKLALGAALFSTRRSNVPVDNPDINSPLPLASAGKQTYRGVELDFTYGPLPGLSVYGSASHIKSANENGNMPRGANRDQAALFASYELQGGAFRGFGARAGAVSVSKIPGNAANTFFLKGYTVAQLQFFRKTGAYSLGLAVNNLFDKKYLASSEGGLVRGVTFGDPRNYTLNAEISF